MITLWLVLGVETVLAVVISMALCHWAQQRTRSRHYGRLSIAVKTLIWRRTLARVSAPPTMKDHTPCEP